MANPDKCANEIKSSESSLCFFFMRVCKAFSDRPNVRFWFGSSAELGGSARFGRTTEPADFTEPEPN